MVACARLGMRVKYIGTVGDDERGRIQLASLRRKAASIWTTSRSAGIARTRPPISWWTRPPASGPCSGSAASACGCGPRALPTRRSLCARMLHIDAHDTPAVARAAEIARRHRIPVTVDVDTIYPGFDRVLPNVDYLIASSEFPERWTSEADPFRALELIQDEYRMPVVAMTLGRYGALALADGRFIYSPAFVVNCIDTTGAGDVFHGAFCYAVIAEYAPARNARIFERHGGSQLHRAGRARRHLQPPRRASADRTRRAALSPRFRAARREPDRPMIPLRSSEPHYTPPTVTLLLIAAQRAGLLL